MANIELLEGEKLDKIKAHVKKHKGKYLLGATVAGALGFNRYYNAKLNDATSNALNKGLKGGIIGKSMDKLDQINKIRDELKPST